MGLEPRYAQYVMAIGKAQDGRQLAEFGLAKAIQLLRLSAPQRRTLLEGRNHIKRLHITELREIIDGLPGRCSNGTGRKTC
jgi:hypothetical protein